MTTYEQVLEAVGDEQLRCFLELGMNSGEYGWHRILEYLIQVDAAVAVANEQEGLVTGMRLTLPHQKLPPLLRETLEQPAPSTISTNPPTLITQLLKNYGNIT